LKRTDKLEQVGGKSRLQGFIGDLDTYGTIEEAAGIVTRTYQHRRLYDAAKYIANAALHQDEDALERAEELIASIALGNNTKGVATFSEAIDRYMEEFAERRDNFKQGIATGVPTGLSDLDRLLGGLRKSRLYTLGGRPGYGKTSLALTIALYVASHAKHALFFSLEMDEDDIVEAALSAELEIDSSLLRDGDLEDHEAERMKRVAERMKRHNLQIADRTYLLSDICSQARQAHLRHPLDLIVVDYWQLVKIHVNGRGKNEQRHEEVAKIGRELKQLARQLQVPILALAQMSRESERKGSAPGMADLAESAGIEQNSDCVMLIYCRDEELARRENSLPYNLSIVVPKHRKGRLGVIDLRFRPKITKFQDTEVASYAEADD
jgi:replicative DNA helicase